MENTSIHNIRSVAGDRSFVFSSWTLRLGQDALQWEKKRWSESALTGIIFASFSEEKYMSWGQIVC